jgi:hypothetical protein
MQSKLNRLWGWLGQWSPIAFLVTGAGFLLALALLVVDTVATVNVPEMAIAVFTGPSLLALLLVGLPGFYPFVAEGSPRLALGGAVVATIGGAAIAVTILGKVALHLLGIIGFTEEGPLLAGFFIVMLALFLSVLLYGAASLTSGEPSRIVGLLLLVIILEPATVLLNDVIGVDVGIVIAFLTLGIAGTAFLAIGYSLRTIATQDREMGPPSESVA